ncbi:12445_t:CDS:10 [Funneliformis caledonium]|uniref:12445_t:CDS:1 n=1 Tax=Funneliformis caledonium TaxID=1117310 RepID=A0A9N9C063_9GLOM|nr:12445_t:CDS:10 [Funneliformis caledonium]
MTCANNPFKFLFHVIFTILFLLVNITYQEYRSLNGEGNNRNDPLAGVMKTPFARNVPSMSNFADENFSMIPTPGNYTTNVPNAFLACNATLPDGIFPLPRCVSNKLMSMQMNEDDIFDLTRLEKFKSKRDISHVLTFWGFFMIMDVSAGSKLGENYPTGIYIPQGDISYLSSYRNGPKPANFTFANESLPFNRSEQGGGQTGINKVTSFVDASTIYGNNADDLQRIRDYGNNGKMRLEIDNSTPDGELGYPYVDENGGYILGYHVKFRNVFTDLFHVILLREHNRLCDEFFAIHGNDWDDEQYFQEARRWVIAFIQRINYYEYLGTALGIPLPKYEGYKPDLKPEIDTFFATVTYRYGHSEVSNFYDIVNYQGKPLATLPLNDLQVPGLLKTFGIPSIALSMALQRQEEVDIYYSDFMRSVTYRAVEQLDIASCDIVRSRDHGIPLYNDARVAFGLPKKTSWADISSDPDVQKRLEDTYGSVDRIEALMGGLAEDHINGGNLGELFYKSFSEQWIKIRDSDRFWFENKDAGFSKEDIAKIQNTTLLTILMRNSPKSSLYPQNLWSVQPTSSLKMPEDSKTYNDTITLSDGFILKWKIDGSDITFLITLGSTNSWFGIGFNPGGDAMSGTDMMIFQNQEKEGSNEITVTGKNYKGIGIGIKPQELPNDQIITILGETKVANGMTQVEVKRPLNAKNRKSIDDTIQMVYAWNPNSNEITYHGGNRGKREVNFRSGMSSALDGRMRLLMMHGIVMFTIWGVLFPSSVWIVRYLRHIDSYMVQHQNLNLFGGLIIGMFATVAMSVTTTHAASTHAKIGLTIFTITIIQISLGIMAIWGLANVESAATGIVRNLKHLHFYLGGALLLTAWVNIFFGMIQYNANKAFIWAYVVWLICFGFVITASEFYYKIKNMQFLWPTVGTNDGTNRLQKCIPNVVYMNLPVVTWDEFNKRVMAGANLVIAEELVFDIHKWIPIHPGGQRILKRVVGTDITRDFFFDPADQIVIMNNSNDYDVQRPSISVLTDNAYGRMEYDTGKKRPHSVANAVDMINATTFKDRRVAMYRHSKFATSKLASMVVARIEQESKQAEIPLHCNIFRRYILTNIETVTKHNAKNPVKKFTFQVLHPDEKLPRFFPGDYIEIMSFVNTQVITRLYTPIQATDNSFYILVKIYKDGIMSQHLNKQLKNFEIKVRGPFDIADRILQLSSPALKPVSRLSSPGLPAQSSSSDHFSRHKNKNRNLNYLPDGRSGILLNMEREDFCCDYLFMVCGGTGITPMLQLIQYHMEKAATLDSNFKLFLLVANDTIADLIYPKYLDNLVQVLEGKLKITYILLKPPRFWNDLSGLIDDTILYDWISQNYSVPPPAIPPRLYYCESDTADIENDNYITTSSSPLYTINEMNNYMRQFTMDDSKQVKLVACGTNQFNDNIRRSLEKLGFPIEEKAIFLN